MDNRNSRTADSWLNNFEMPFESSYQFSEEVDSNYENEFRDVESENSTIDFEDVVFPGENYSADNFFGESEIENTEFDSYPSNELETGFSFEVDSFVGSDTDSILQEMEAFELEREIAFEQLIPAPKNPPACKIDDKKKNAIGFEFDMLVSISTELEKLSTLPDKTQVSDHNWKDDGFKLKIDGNKIEVATAPFELSPTGLKDLEKAFANIKQWVDAFESSVRPSRTSKTSKTVSLPVSSGSDSLAGTGVFVTGDDVGKTLKIKSTFSTSGHFLFPLKTAIANLKNYYTGDPRVSAVPQATLGIPLSSVSKLVDKIQQSEGKPVGFGLSLRSGRTGLRSDALYNAKTRVELARAFFIKKGKHNGVDITKSTFTDQLTGFMILLVEYLWTSVIEPTPNPDPKTGGRGDYEVFSKAYVPLHSKTRFREMFHCLLTDTEKELFYKVFWEGDNWKTLASLTKQIKGRPGGITDVTDALSRKLFPAKITASASKPTWQEFVDSIIKNELTFEKASGTNTLVSGPTNAIDLEARGVILELRRMGFGVLPATQWRAMALPLFKMAMELNK